jgi:hypothetical protein
VLAVVFSIARRKVNITSRPPCIARCEQYSALQDEGVGEFRMNEAIEKAL